MPIFGIWFSAAVALLIVEIASTTFFAVFLSVGAVAGGLLALVAPDSPFWVQGVVATVVAIAGVVVVRPILARRLQGRGPGAISPGTHGGFVGQRALALDVIGDQLHPGHVRLAGETWMAYTEVETPIDPNAAVVVTAVRGTTLTVRPAG